MSLRFTPLTDLERAFAQAAGWEIDKLWKEADRSGDKKDWNRFYGQAFCLVYHCANGGQTRHLNTRSSWLHRLLPGFGFLYEATDRLIGARAFSPKI